MIFSDIFIGRIKVISNRQFSQQLQTNVSNQQLTLSKFKKILTIFILLLLLIIYYYKDINTKMPTSLLLMKRFKFVIPNFEARHFNNFKTVLI